MSYLLAIVLSYLIGSFPTGYVVVRLLAGVDVRTVGSGRTGGTNVYRAAGKSAALMTIGGDILKGVLAVALARLLWADPLVTALAAFFVVIGHNYSLFLRFAGGAGTITGMAALLGLDPIVFLFVAPIPLLFVYITRMSSIASLLASAISLLVALLLVWQGYFPPPYLLYFVGFFLLSWYSHRPNIQRLMAGTERRIGGRTQA